MRGGQKFEKAETCQAGRRDSGGLVRLDAPVAGGWKTAAIIGTLSAIGVSAARGERMPDSSSTFQPLREGVAIVGGENPREACRSPRKVRSGEPSPVPCIRRVEWLCEKEKAGPCVRTQEMGNLQMALRAIQGRAKEVADAQLSKDTYSNSFRKSWYLKRTSSSVSWPGLAWSSSRWTPPPRHRWQPG